MSYNVHNARHKTHKLNEAIAGSKILLPLPNKRRSPMPRPDNQVPSGCHLVFTRMESTLRLSGVSRAAKTVGELSGLCWSAKAAEIEVQRMSMRGRMGTTWTCGRHGKIGM